MVSVGAAVDALAFEDVDLERRSGAYVEGLWVPADATTSTIRANVQPASGRDMRRLPEGQRSQDAVVIFARTLLRVADVGGQLMADVVTYGGERWQVVFVANWMSYGYCEALATREAI